MDDLGSQRACDGRVSCTWLVGAVIAQWSGEHPSMFPQAKLYLIAHLHLAKDALHIYVGLLVFVGVMLLFGWRAHQWKPWLAVLIVALAGELWDLIDAMAYLSQPYYWGHWHDIWNTMFWPSAIMLLARFTRVFHKGS